MKNVVDMQKDMYRDIRDGSLFKKAYEYGYEYLESAFDRNVYPTQKAIQNLDAFRETLPQSPSNASEVIDLLNRFGSPATVSQIGGRYFGFVCGSAVPVGLAAKILSTFWDQNAAMHVLSPLASTLESVVEKWFRQIFNLPERTVAGFVSGTSLATFCGLAAARYRILRRLDWDINEKGLFGAPPIRVVTGSHAHSTVIKAIGLLGFGKGNIEWVDVDDDGRIIPNRIPMLDDRTILVLQAGNVNGGSYDPFEEICEKANKANAWVHIDGAFGLWAAATRKLRHLTKGMENANSWSVDGHKTLNTPYDCGIILCEDADAIVSALHMTGSYIVVSDSKDGMFYTPEMSRRARIIELWAILKFLGKSGIDEMVTGMHERAVQFSLELKDNGFEILNDVVFNQVLVACGDDELTERTITNIQDSGECWVGGAKWHGKTVIRISVSSWATTEEDVIRSVRSFVTARDKAVRGAAPGK
jgi:glutamate/tyrosine decarboxylase-like PLP-dependent enzyme